MGCDFCLWGSGMYLPFSLQLSPLESERTGSFLCKICKVVCMPSVFLWLEHRLCLLHCALSCLTQRAFEGTQSCTNQDLFARLLAQEQGLGALPVPLPHSVSFWVSLSSLLVTVHLPQWGAVGSLGSVVPGEGSAHLF